MYSTPGEPDQSPTSLATDILADDTGQVLLSLQDSLNEAWRTMKQKAGDPGEASVAQDVSMRLDSAFEVAHRILETARTVRSRRT